MNPSRSAVLFLTALGVACAAHNPGEGVTPSVVDEYGCDYQTVMERATARDTLPGGKVYIRRVGWDACNLLAHNGKPTRATYQQTERQRYMSWWYEGNTNTGLITLTFDRSRKTGSYWVVTYVGWKP